MANPELPTHWVRVPGFSAPDPRRRTVLAGVDALCSRHVPTATRYEAGSDDRAIVLPGPALKEATIANMVGSIVKHAIQAGLVKPANVIELQKVPHAQIVRL